MWNNGKYKGWIWTLEAGKFDRTDVRHFRPFLFKQTLLTNIWWPSGAILPSSQKGLFGDFRRW